VFPGAPPILFFVTYNQTKLMNITNIAIVENFSDKLKKQLIEKNLTQGQLSIKTGIKRATIANYVTGRSEPPLKKFYIICQALDIKNLN
jgi:DNA-binding XRE family transcriptional regulator